MKDSESTSTSNQCKHCIEYDENFKNTKRQKCTDNNHEENTTQHRAKQREYERKWYEKIKMPKMKKTEKDTMSTKMKEMQKKESRIMNTKMTEMQNEE